MIKKILISIILIGILTGSAFAQTISENLQTIYDSRKQAVDIASARDMLDQVYVLAVEKNVEIQALVDSGEFDQIPLNVKQALNQAWTLLKNYIAAMEANSEIMECMDFEWSE